ncbi:bifunctional NAD(P)/FAD-dependent oxidoreductase/class I SAM-dependent methyltransferase [Nocardioides albus]|uniref:Thioredoxin reductase/SAM-dependent methyltransferase n=1 Tax=Nocardioides albus TaxID=1841 RepID=A0A7W5A878_9ACTN|nr:bifunctional NAD(P)/FAD-dependent oxidoreductase/class I SAM-dependent methyltransferase [Nocardioides albus]MBB3091383.1 thioredoxin reductase/SAM-dependent methyltransferase [Nocardioides albus]GGU39596.1 methyltransferase [Nocardioides albus]
MTENTEHLDAIVIGGGAAGLSAALMLGRSRRRTLVVDSGLPRNRFAAHMNGVLGHDGLDPADLLRKGREELAAYDVGIRPGRVARLDETEHGVSVLLEDGERLTGRIAIVATGVTDELPDIPGLAERWGTTVLHCPYCHGWEVRDRRIGVLTTSPLGMHQAQLIRQWSDDVVVFTAGLGPVEEADEQRLLARGVTLVPEPVVEVLGEGDQVTAVRTADGKVTEVGAIFTAGTLRPHDGFLTHLGLERTDTPVGSFLAVDPTGKTSSDRIWAVGNVSNPMANVPISMSAGTMAGSVVNMTLVTDDFDRAVAGTAEAGDPVAFWQERYAGGDRIWSGKVNAVLGDVASGLEPGTALDLGSGEGADVIWLAQQGWQATGIDISENAATRGREAAHAAGLSDERAKFVVSDLSDPAVLDKGYDLVTASFFHSPVELPRTDILRRAAGLVNPGGHLLITSHAAAPPWAEAAAHEHHFLDAKGELEELDLPEEGWETVVLEHRNRPVTNPSGEPATLEDAVVLLRRLG